eukprot:gene16001-33652_t
MRAQDPLGEWDEWTMSFAAKIGHMDVLKWLRAQDPPCQWSADTCAEAAKYGHLNILKWLRSQNPPCPWDLETCRRVARGKDHVNVWLQTHLPTFVYSSCSKNNLEPKNFNAI